MSIDSVPPVELLPIMVDTSPPVPGDMLDGDALRDLQYQPYDHRMCAQWPGCYDPESGIAK
jgi:hypothetical protein